MPLPGELLPGEGYVPSAGPLYQSAAGQAEAHRNGVVHPLHHRAVHPAHPLPQAAFVQGADLLQQEVMAAAMTVGLWRLPVSFCTISTGRTPPCSLPTTGLRSA